MRLLLLYSRRRGRSSFESGAHGVGGTARGSSISSAGWMRRHCGITRLKITMAGLGPRDKGGLQRSTTGSETRRRSGGSWQESGVEYEVWNSCALFTLPEFERDVIGGPGVLRVGPARLASPTLQFARVNRKAGIADTVQLLASHSRHTAVLKSEASL